MHLAFNAVQNEILPRFDMSDKDGIIFDPLVPRAGQRLTAKCSIVGRTPENIKSVSWSLDRQNDGKSFFLAVNTRVFQFKTPFERLRALHDPNSNDWFLIFDPLDRDDIGNLTCTLADTGNTNVNLTRFLDVHSDPIILESSTKDVEVDIGANISLNCLSQGYPQPNVSWIRADGRPLPGGFARHYVIVSYNLRILKILFLYDFFFKGGQFEILNIKKEDRGVYKCVSTNLIGNGAEWTLKIAVRCN